MLDPSHQTSYQTLVYCSKPYLAACELQRLLLGQAREPQVKGVVLSGLSRAFVELEECKRKLKMRPLPKSIDTTKIVPKSQRKSSSAGFTEA